MAMVTAMVMATGADRTVRCPRRLLRPSSPIALRRLPAGAGAASARNFLVVGIGCVVATTPALADWRFSSSAGITETYTNNVNYASGSNTGSDFATTINGGIAINGNGARVRLNGTVGATALFYAKETQNNTFAPSVILAGSVEAIENFFFIDANANVNQTFYSPFGPQPGNLVNATANRFTQQTYSLSPYIRGRIPGTNLTYHVRDDNIWTLSSQFGDSSVEAPNTYFNGFNGSISSPVAPWGWTLELTRNHYAPTENDIIGSYTTEVARVILTYQIDPQVQVSLRGGYERDRFPLTSSNGAIYGAGLQWFPSDRTQVSGFWEHRFFGPSYQVQINHRLPRVAFSAAFVRGLNTYPQNALTIPAGVNVPTFIDAAFKTRIPDPAERALAVQQFLAQSGFPLTLATPVNVFAANVQLQTTGSASAVWIGVRNSLAFSVYYTKSEAISGTGQVLPPALQFGQNNTQTGGGVSFSHRLSAFTSLTGSATYSTTKSNESTGAFSDAKSRNGYLTFTLATQLAPRTTGSVGANYTRYSPTGDVGIGIDSSSSSYSIFAGVNHAF